MANIFYAGNFPSCSGLYSRAVACSTNHGPTGVWPAGVVGHGGAATHQAAYAGGSNPGAFGPWDPQMLAQLSVLMQNTGIRDAMGNNVFSKK